MQDVLPRRKEWREVFHELLRVYLGGFRLRPVYHGAVEIVEGDGLPQIVAVFLAVQIKVKANVMDVPVFKMFL